MPPYVKTILGWLVTGALAAAVGVMIVYFVMELVFIIHITP